MSQGVTEAMARWFEIRPPLEPGDQLFRKDDGAAVDQCHLARDLREHLALAGIRRPQLFERSEHRMWMRVHDLRATFVTVALANGRTESWVADRTGHMSSQMINRYRRKVRMHQESSLGDLGAAAPYPHQIATRTKQETPRLCEGF